MDTPAVSSSTHLTSVILVSFQTGDILFRAIESIRAQEMLLEIILVDNGNPPHVVAQLQQVAEEDRRVHLITGHGNIGFGRGTNLGVAASRGDHLLILNPDSLLSPDCLVGLYTHARTMVSPFMIGARVINEDGTDQRGCRRELLTPSTALVESLHLGRLFPRWRLNLHKEPMPASLTPVPAISGSFMFLPRKDYDLIGGFDEGYFLHVEDLDLCLRFRRAGGEIWFAPDISVTHIGGTSAVSSDFIEKHKAISFIRYFHRNFGDKYPRIVLWCLDIAIWGRYFLRRIMK